MEITFLLVGLAGAGIYISSLPDTTPPDGTKKNPVSMANVHLNDMTESGYNYVQFRPQALTSTNLNDAYAPYASPATDPTYSMPQVFGALADNGATVEAYGPNFYFEHWMEIPYTTAQQATHNISIPGPGGFKGGASLVNYPRVYMDNESKEFTSKRNLRAGMPTETEIRRSYPESTLAQDHNPYGAGAPFQRLTGRRYARNTVERGADLSSKPNIVNFGPL